METNVNFNIINEQDELLCPVCGFAGFSSEPAYDKGVGLIGIALCPCCFWEPGFDDVEAASSRAKGSVLESIKDYRKRWSVNMQWEGKQNLRPQNFDPSKQLSELFQKAAHLR